MKSKVLRELQEYIYSLKGDNGNWRKTPVGIVGKAHTSEKNLERLKIIINILLASDKLSDDTKIYISNRKLSIKAANDILNDARQLASEKLGKHLKNVSYQTTVTRINNDEVELAATIGANFLKELVYDIQVSDKEYNKRLTDLVKKYGTYEKQRNNLGFYLDTSIVSCDKYKGNEEFFQILSKLECYLVQRRDELERQINGNKEFVGYFNYLLSAKSVSDIIVAKDRERLLNFLSGGIYLESDTPIVEDEHDEAEVDYVNENIGANEMYIPALPKDVLGVEKESDTLDFDIDECEEYIETNDLDNEYYEDETQTEDYDSNVEEEIEYTDEDLMVEDYKLELQLEVGAPIDKEKAVNRFSLTQQFKNNEDTY